VPAMNVRRLSRKAICFSLWRGVVCAAYRLPVLDLPVCVARPALLGCARRRCPCDDYNML
jgi:hypothetical protein